METVVLAVFFENSISKLVSFNGAESLPGISLTGRRVTARPATALASLTAPCIARIAALPAALGGLWEK